MRRKVLFTFMAALALSSCASPAEEKPHSYETAKDFTVLRADSQAHYIMGLADGFTYLSAKTGHQRSLSDCFRKYGAHVGNLIIRFDSFIKTPQIFDQKYAGPPPETLPAAEAFDKLISLYCKDERTGTPATRKENPHSFATGKDYVIWNANGQIYYVRGLADAFAYLAQKTGYLEGISKCYRQDRVNSAHLMNQFIGYVENYKFYDKDYSGPDPKTLPAAEAFLQFNELLCEGILKDK